MALQLDTHFDFNRLVWICLLRPEDQGPSLRIIDDVSSLSRQIGFIFDKYFIKSAKHLEEVLSQLEDDVGCGKYPTIFFDAHGNREAGLEISISQEMYNWMRLADDLRRVNIRTNNNLSVVGASCYGLQAAASIDISIPTPFFILLAPEEEIKTGYLEDNVAKFYRELFTELNIDLAHAHHLAEFKMYHCEEILVSAMSRYISQKCKGKGGRERREELLTKLLRRNHNSNLQDARRMIKNGLMPTQQMIDRYAETFLMGRISVKIEDILEYIN